MAGYRNRYGHNQLEDQRMYSMSPLPGISTGRPSLDMALNILLGGSLTPRPLPGSTQGIYDAYRMRDRNMDFLAARNNAFANNLFAQQLGGIDPNSNAFRFLSPFLTDPDGPVMKMMSPLMGGNPVKAQMGLYADLTGQTMGAFGQNRNISLRETDELMRQTYSSLFNTERIDSVKIKEFKDKAIGRAQSRFGVGSEQLTDFREATRLGGKEGLAMLERKYGSEDNSRLASLIERTMDAVKKTSEDNKLTESQQHDEINKIKDQARSAANEFLDKITDPQARLKLSQAFTKAIEDSSYGAQGFKKDFSAVNADLISMLRGVSRYEGKNNQEVARSINFQRTRGFQIEDITSGFAAAADYRLVAKGGVSKAYEDFAKHGVSVMDAAREVYGNNKSGDDLLAEIDQLLGSSYINLGDEKQAGELEQLLRNIKATARTQSVSTQDIMGLIAQGKQMAAFNPALRDMGGMEIANMALRSMVTTGAQSAYLGNDYIRRMGGPVALAQRQMAGEIDSASQDVTRRSAAMYEYFASRGNEGATKLIEDFTSGKSNYKVNMEGFTQFIKELSSTTGENAYTLLDFAENNTEAASLGLRRNTGLAKAGGEAARQQFKDFLIDPVGKAALKLAMGGGNVSLESVVNEFGVTSEKDMTTLQGINKRLKDGETIGLDSMMSALGRKDQAGFVKFLMDNGYDEGFRDEYDTTYKAIKAKETLFRDESAKISKEMSAKLAHLNAPITQTVFNQLMNGTVKEGGIMELLSPLKEGSPQYAAMEAEVRKIEALGDKKTIGALADFYKGAIKGNVEGQMENLVQVSGAISYDDIRRYANGGKSLLADEVDELKKSGRDPARLAALEKVNIETIKRANDTLKQIDPNSELHGKDDIYEFSKKKGIKSVLDIYQKDTVEKYNNQAKDRFKEIINGENLPGFDAATKDMLQKDFKTLQGVFKDFGVYSDKDGFDAVKYEKLRSDYDSVDGHKFRSKLESLTSKKEVSKEGKSMFDAIVGTHAEGMSGINSQNKALMDSLNSSQSMGKVAESMTELSNRLGSNFGAEIIQAIRDLGEKISVATR